MSFWSDVVGDVSKYYTEAWAAATGGAVQNASGDVASAANAAGSSVAAAAGTATLAAGIWTDLKDYKMWRSLGWLVLGIILMLAAVAWWIGPSAQRAAPLGLAAEGLG